MQFVTPALNSEDPYHRKAALIALAVLAEGCADYIRNRLVFVVDSFYLLVILLFYSQLT